MIEKLIILILNLKDSNPQDRNNQNKEQTIQHHQELKHQNKDKTIQHHQELRLQEFNKLQEVHQTFKDPQVRK
jgi:hypothetical protein